MARLKEFRDVKASLWQSAVDQVIAKEQAGSSGAAGFGHGPSTLKRPSPNDASIDAANDLAALLNRDAPLPDVAAPSPAAGVADTVKFCSMAALKLAEARVSSFFSGDDTELKRARAQLQTKFDLCDPRWAQVLEVYAASRIAQKQIPYRRHQKLSDFVIDGRLGAQAKVAIIADWGTGQDNAKRILAKVAARKPDVVIHLGDVYYSGTESEVQNYFYALWQKVLGLEKVGWGGKLKDLTAKPATFHLTGNHDMYAGGAPYYTVIDMLGQPASYFCLRNEHWQFVAMDTGLHDANPVTQGQPTFLEDSEAAWVRDKVTNAGGRKTVLLSHHQLYSTFENFAGEQVNGKLLAQVKDVLGKVALWFWGHEHNLVVYKKFQGVAGRCVGHGAFPVAAAELKAPNAAVPIEDVKLEVDGDGFYQHGYVMMELDGAAGKVTYYQHDLVTDTEKAVYVEKIESGEAAGAH